MSRSVLLSALMLAAVTGPSALANSQDNFGFGIRGMGLAGAMTAEGGDFSATYYNPAALGRVSGLKLSVDGVFADYRAKVDGSNLAQQAESMNDLLGGTFGIAGHFPFGSEESIITFGMGVFTPLNNLVSASSTTDGTKPIFSQIGETRDKIHVLPAIAIRVFDRDSFDSLGLGTLYIGFGASILTDVGGKIEPGIDLSSSANQTVDVNFSFQAEWDAAPYAGLLYEPADWLRLGVAYRGEISLKVDMDINIETVLARDSNGEVVSSIEVPIKLEQVALFDPQQVALGVAVDATDELTFLFDATWQNWSAFPSHANVLTSSIVPTPTRVDPNFDDIWVLRFGAEWSPVRNLDLRVGYGYLPSPVPEQTGDTNIFDSDRHLFSLGLGYFWEDAPQPVIVDTFFQFQMYENRDNQKTNAADTVGSTEISGGILAFGIGFTFPF